MPWFRVDDKVAFGPKHLAAGNEAVGAWVRAGAWSSAHGTDGLVPDEVAHAIAPKRVWKHLIEARAGREHGLVERAEGGYRLHDFLVYNPSAAEADGAARERSEAKARAGRAGGLRSGEVRRGEAETKQNRSRLLPALEAESKQPASRTGSTGQAKRSPDPDPDPGRDPRPKCVSGDLKATRTPESENTHTGKPVSGGSSPEVARILEALQSNAVLRAAFAQDRTADGEWFQNTAERLEGHRCSTGRSLDVVLRAIDDAARDLAALQDAQGCPPAVRIAGEKLGRYVTTALARDAAARPRSTETPTVKRLWKQGADARLSLTEADLASGEGWGTS